MARAGCSARAFTQNVRCILAPFAPFAPFAPLTRFARFARFAPFALSPSKGRWSWHHRFDEPALSLSKGSPSRLEGLRRLSPSDPPPPSA